MKNVSKLTLVVLLLAAGAARSNAQNTTIKVTQDLSFNLTGYYQMSPTENPSTLFRHAGKISITSRDIINLLGKQVNIVFSSGARLQLISDTSTNQPPIVVVHDRFEGTVFDTDVTQYFTAQTIASVEETKIKKNPVTVNGKSYDVMAFVMTLDQVQFATEGMGVLTVKTVKYQGNAVGIFHTGRVNTAGKGNYQVNYITGVVPIAITGTVQVSNTQVKAM